VDDRPVLVLGATGYVGSRLVPRLLERGVRVRAASRSERKLMARPWARDPRVEHVVADALDEASLERACAGCRAVYYLVHSMGPGGGARGETGGFAAADLRAARNLARAAERAGVGRVLYLGGLGEASPDLSEHLRSRQEVARALREGRVPVTVLRAGVILGSGSASFEILRYLVERLPVMVTPRWVRTPTQPIAIRDVLGYLAGCLERPETAGETFDLGGPEVLTYQRLMAIYAEEAGLRKRLVVPVPVLSPRLSSYWIQLVTPAPGSLARPLALGLRNPVLARDTRINDVVPQRLLTPRQAIRRALDLTQLGRIESHWTDAGAMPPAAWSYEGDPAWTGGTVLEDAREANVPVAPEVAWAPLVRLGGSTGWYYADWLWRARGRIDKLAGGVGLRRGRRDAQDLRPGDALDFWRVVEVEPARRLVLVAEMRLPGEALLEFDLEPLSDGGTRITQRARFRPLGLAGLAYWYGVYPLHALVFRGMLRAIARAAGGAVEGPAEGAGMGRAPRRRPAER
jgi:uncharacterized protein YbjT (DUF2867 family)